MVKITFIFTLMMSALGWTQDLVEMDQLSSYFVGINEAREYILKRSIKREAGSSCIVDPYFVNNLDHYFRGSQSVPLKGKIFYRGYWRGAYNYDLVHTPRGFIIHVKIHFRNFRDYSREEQEKIFEKVEEAQDIWNAEIPFEYALRFNFQIVPNRERAHLSDIILTEKDVRGPYFFRWSTKWSSKVFAHEFGHVMGLDDEYDDHILHEAQGKDFDCHKQSIMCKSSSGKILPEHYYMILRRYFCASKHDMSLTERLRSIVLD